MTPKERLEQDKIMQHLGSYVGYFHNDEIIARFIKAFLAYRDEVLEEAIAKLPVSPATRRVSAQLIRALKTGAK